MPKESRLSRVIPGLQRCFILCIATIFLLAPDGYTLMTPVEAALLVVIPCPPGSNPTTVLTWSYPSATDILVENCTISNPVQLLIQEQGAIGVNTQVAFRARNVTFLNGFNISLPFLSSSRNLSAVVLESVAVKKFPLILEEDSVVERLAFSAYRCNFSIGIQIANSSLSSSLWNLTQCIIGDPATLASSVGFTVVGNMYNVNASRPSWWAMNLSLVFLNNTLYRAQSGINIAFSSSPVVRLVMVGNVFSQCAYSLDQRLYYYSGPYFSSTSTAIVLLQFVVKNNTFSGSVTLQYKYATGSLATLDFSQQVIQASSFFTFGYGGCLGIAALGPYSCLPGFLSPGEYLIAAGSWVQFNTLTMRNISFSQFPPPVPGSFSGIQVGFLNLALSNVTITNSTVGTLQFLSCGLTGGFQLVDSFVYGGFTLGESSSTGFTFSFFNVSSLGWPLKRAGPSFFLQQNVDSTGKFNNYMNALAQRRGVTFVFDRCNFNSTAANLFAVTSTTAWNTNNTDPRIFSLECFRLIITNSVFLASAGTSATTLPTIPPRSISTWAPNYKDTIMTMSYIVIVNSTLSPINISLANSSLLVTDNVTWAPSSANLTNATNGAVLQTVVGTNLVRCFVNGSLPCRWIFGPNRMPTNESLLQDFTFGRRLLPLRFSEATSQVRFRTPANVSINITQTTVGRSVEDIFLRTFPVSPQGCNCTNWVGPRIIPLDSPTMTWTDFADTHTITATAEETLTYYTTPPVPTRSRTATKTPAPSTQSRPRTMARHRRRTETTTMVDSPAPIAAAALVATTTTATAVSVAASAIAGGAAGGAAADMQSLLILGLMKCSPSVLQSMASAGQLAVVPVRIGKSSYAGVLGGLTLWLGMIFLHFVVSLMVWRLFPAKCPSPSAAFALLKFSGLSVGLSALLWQGVSYEGLHLLIGEGSPNEVLDAESQIVGALTLLCFFSTPIVFTYWGSCRTAGERYRPFTAIKLPFSLLTLIAPKGWWVTSTLGGAMMQSSFTAYTNPKRHSWFILVNYLRSLFVSIMAVRGQSWMLCRGQGIAISVFYTLCFMPFLVLRPHVFPLQTFGSFVLTALTIFIVVSAMVVPNSFPVDATTTALTATTVVGAVSVTSVMCCRFWRGKLVAQELKLLGETSEQQLLEKEKQSGELPSGSDGSLRRDVLIIPGPLGGGSRSEGQQGVNPLASSSPRANRRGRFRSQDQSSDEEGQATDMKQVAPGSSSKLEPFIMPDKRKRSTDRKRGSTEQHWGMLHEEEDEQVRRKRVQEEDEESEIPESNSNRFVAANTQPDLYGNVQGPAERQSRNPIRVASASATGGGVEQSLVPDNHRQHPHPGRFPIAPPSPSLELRWNDPPPSMPEQSQNPAPKQAQQSPHTVDWATRTNTHKWPHRMDQSGPAWSSEFRDEFSDDFLVESHASVGFGASLMSARAFEYGVRWDDEYAPAIPSALPPQSRRSYSSPRPEVSRGSGEDGGRYQHLRRSHLMSGGAKQLLQYGGPSTSTGGTEGTVSPHSDELVAEEEPDDDEMVRRLMEQVDCSAPLPLRRSDLDRSTGLAPYEFTKRTQPIGVPPPPKRGARRRRSGTASREVGSPIRGRHGPQEERVPDTSSVRLLESLSSFMQL
jgi:hypothetical protein